MLDELLDRRVLGVDVRALENTWQKTGLPVLRFLDRVAVGAHGNKRRQVLVFAAQSVTQPRAEARPNLPGIAAVHEHQRRLVIGHVGMHRTDHRDLVDRLGRAGKKVADLDPALAIAAEFEWRRERGPSPPFGPQRAGGQFLAGVLGEHRLGIERIDVRWPAVHEQVDDVLCFGREMRSARQQRISAGGLGAGLSQHAT